ncbi:MAG: hypothetical protein LC791_00090 [Acidobacteria bacterium]|nr:hypothetical protein [Acidobacteriota bacterium]
MPRKAKSPTAQSPPARKPDPTESVTLIVRRGAQRRFDKLAEATKDLPATVSWDRRHGERRTASHKVEQERRKTERRRTPPFTWQVADFVVVSVPSDPDVDPEEDK